METSYTGQLSAAPCWQPGDSGDYALSSDQWPHHLPRPAPPSTPPSPGPGPRAAITPRPQCPRLVFTVLLSSYNNRSNIQHSSFYNFHYQTSPLPSHLAHSRGCSDFSTSAWQCWHRCNIASFSCYLKKAQIGPSFCWKCCNNQCCLSMSCILWLVGNIAFHPCHNCQTLAFAAAQTSPHFQYPIFIN